MQAGYGTLQEVRLQWSIDDLYDALELLDVNEDGEARNAAKLRAKHG